MLYGSIYVIKRKIDDIDYTYVMDKMVTRLCELEEENKIMREQIKDILYEEKE